MTGLYNRRLLDQHLPPIIDRCRNTQTHLSLLMIDVDHFKKLNDTLGHAAGDEMLRDIAQIIRSTIRENDSAFRYGGDEFVVVLEGFDAEAGQALGDRLISLVDALRKPCASPPNRGCRSVWRRSRTSPMPPPPHSSRRRTNCCMSVNAAGGRRSKPPSPNAWRARLRVAAAPQGRFRAENKEKCPFGATATRGFNRLNLD